jgi:ligand-binding sensor domain-containing protein
MQSALKYTVITFFLLATHVMGQGIALGQWTDYLPSNKGIRVTELKKKMYCATQYGVVILNKEDNSIERLSRSNGLSDIDISSIASNNNTVIVGYKDGNIDLIKDGNITNFSEIKRTEAIQGAKKIFNIRVKENFAYISCNFGIVVYDINKNEIKSTLYPSTETPEIYQVCFDDSIIYAATSKGIFTANLNNTLLPYYVAWTKIEAAGNRPSNNIEKFENAIYFSRFTQGAFGQDTVFKIENNVLSVFKGADNYYAINKQNNNLLIASNYNLTIVKPQGAPEDVIYNYNNGIVPTPRDAIVDAQDPSVIWVADNNQCLAKCTNIFSVEVFSPSGPKNQKVFNLAQNQGNIWVSTGAFDPSFTPLYNIDGVYKYDGVDWQTYQLPFASDYIRDIVHVNIDPSNPNHAWISSWGNGLAEIKDGQLENVFNRNNSTLAALPNDSNQLRIGGSVLDRDGHLWVSNAGVPKPISMRNTQGDWFSYNISGLINNRPTGTITVDSSNQKWMIIPEIGVVVFKNDENQITDYKLLNEQAGSGSMTSANVLSLAQDLEGQMWVGTSKGINVFYSPEAILAGGNSNWEAQLITISQGGFNQYLLNSEEVTAIAVDGGNRKWLGTKKAGVFLVSPDGTSQIQHFTVTNSPLLSNTINSIVINEKTGEVFFGTSAGICSYRSDATKGDDVFGKIYAFPNPVRPDYNGPIAITGLVTDADVKITDVQGNIVFSTRANGGTAVWNGLNFSGKRVATGVYLVFCANTDGSQTKVTKILMVN